MDSKTSIKAEDGNTYEITNEMVKIYLKSEKISGKYLLKQYASSLDPLYMK